MAATNRQPLQQHDLIQLQGQLYAFDNMLTLLASLGEAAGDAEIRPMSGWQWEQMFRMLRGQLVETFTFIDERL